GLRGVNALAAYVSSKWGVRGLTKVAALELGHQGVRVNSIHPGGVNTAMSNPTGAPLEEINQHYANVPLQRVGLPDEIARATLFLASDEASYCNGAELAVDGGMAAGAYYPGLPGAPF
ncbi:SDR family oxidoreductase, partial [Klebsiella pneumoniae]|nr:SDR family oxidoreductase [Klebsiella pneumoniae]